MDNTIDFAIYETGILHKNDFWSLDEAIDFINSLNGEQFRIKLFPFKESLRSKIKARTGRKFKSKGCELISVERVEELNWFIRKNRNKSLVVVVHESNDYEMWVKVVKNQCYLKGLFFDKSMVIKSPKSD